MLHLLRTLSHEGGGGGRIVSPVGRELLGELVITRQAVNAGLDENETELGVHVLAVALEVLAHADSLFNQVVQILGQSGGKTETFENAKHLAVGHGGHLRDAVVVAEENANLGRRHAFLGHFADRLGNLVGGNLEPRRSRSLVGKG